ncbi:adenylosuccinate synthetase [Emcibacter nanhaiensis]|uniref:Adenylosuccinate synthetase n=1 Tax=Emcibacter nanhaiensis TaxID=1505037 RepID=A0A501PH87_9PROT|nr:adenylosuccinate synthetase [Emcibacter nanhaiensis]TPD59402.1 adenylosuccinate synthase [Emcibacter nanhaiensis]
MITTLKLIIISGEIACGKSQLAKDLRDATGFPVVKTSDLILQQKPRTKKERTALQRAGNKLDNETGFAWIADAVGRLRRKPEYDLPIILDGVRKQGQIEALQKSFGHRHLKHVHLRADFQVRKERFVSRERDTDRGVDFDRISRNTSEKGVSKLEHVADIVVDTDRFTGNGVFSHVYSRLNLVSRSSDQLVDVLIGGQLGSEGKGNIADYLSPEYGILMRVGGPNAGHKIYEDPPYTHRSLPCGCRRNEKAKILIGPGAVVNPQGLLKEIRECEISPDRLTIDENVAIISQEDIDWEEQFLKKGIGSTAQGVGAAASRRIRNRFRDEKVCKLAKNLGEICPDLLPYVGPTYKHLEKAYAEGHKILLEGTQGTGLSLYHGEYPSVTSRDTTVSGCLAEAGIGPRRVRKIVLVCRTYPIRVGGNSGGMDKETTWEVIAERSGNDLQQLRSSEVGSVSGNPRRVCEFDWSLLRKACHLNSPTDIALTFVDHIDIKNANAARFEQLTKETINFIEAVESVSGVPCSLIANKFDFKCVIDRRRW